MLPSLWMSRTRETVKPTPAKPLKWAAYGAFFGALIIVWGPNLFGLPGALNSEPFRIYVLIGEIIGGAVVYFLHHRSEQPIGNYNLLE